MTTAMAVSMHTPMESTSGSHRAVKPSVAGSFVFEALWAMPAEPTPAALENSAVLASGATVITTKREIAADDAVSEILTATGRGSR